MSNLDENELTALFDELEELSKELEENSSEEKSEEEIVIAEEAKSESKKDEDIVENAKEIVKKAISKKTKEKVEVIEEPEKEVVTSADATKAKDDATSKKLEEKPKHESKSESVLSHHSSSVDVESFNKETRLTDSNLDDCMMSQSALMAYYTAQSSRSNADVARAKLKFEVLEASLYSAYRKKLTDDGEKATEKSIENLVRLDARWQKAKEEIIQAQMISDIHTGFVHSLRDRKDMMIQKGSDRREELKSKLRILGDVEVDLSEKASELGKSYINKE